MHSPPLLPLKPFHCSGSSSGHTLGTEVCGGICSQLLSHLNKNVPWASEWASSCHQGQPTPRPVLGPALLTQQPRAAPVHAHSEPTLARPWPWMASSSSPAHASCTPSQEATRLSLCLRAASLSRPCQSNRDMVPSSSPFPPLTRSNLSSGANS